MNYEEMKEKLEKYNQTHVLAAYDRADDATKEKLLTQVERIDFEQLKELYHMTQTEIKFENNKIEPMPYVDSAKLNEEEKKKYIEIGENIIRSGKLAVVTMAGGQGTRLGHNGPKGTFDLGLESHKSLFEILTDYLKNACEKYHVTIPWYIMTSKDNNRDTVEFFESHNFFDYPKDGIRMFFKQGELPMLDENGKVIINEEGIIKEAADGHGGIFEAIFKDGALEDMKNRGIEWIFVGSVDNPLVKMADPLFIGYAAANNYMAASKTIVKAYPEEKVGVFCKKDGMPYVIEYTEISNEMAHQRDENGELSFGEAHMLLNLFNIQTLEKIKEVKLPYHSAHKKSNLVDEKGNVIIPEKPNAYKFETFIFDAFALIPDVGLLRGKREDDFAPVKNAEGNDSPVTARKLYEDYMKRNGMIC
ncbi:MAG: UTP--glucose-1-phosphate uridylyltransferase [Clostridia bacterium]|nr:UTP--glucose-1-phosphate uridylyltransferase [Clostridia bacterium]